MTDTNNTQVAMSPEREAAAIARSQQMDAVTFDHIAGVFSNGLAFKLAERMADRMANSMFLPASYKNNPDNCLVLIDFAARLRMSPIALAQGMHVVKGKPALDGKMIAGLINASDRFTDDLEYEWQGNPGEENWGCRCFAVRKSNGKTVYGAWVRWVMVVSERWNVDGKTQSGDTIKSKWNTMPELMFAYRAAAFFGRQHTPDLLLGIGRTSDELEDMGDVIQGEYTRVPSAAERANEKIDRAMSEAEVTADFTVRHETEAEPAKPQAKPEKPVNRRSATKPKTEPEPEPAAEPTPKQAPEPVPVADPAGDGFDFPDVE